MTIREHPAHLDHDPARVVAEFFLPGEGSALVALARRADHRPSARGAGRRSRNGWRPTSSRSSRPGTRVSQTSWPRMPEPSAAASWVTRLSPTLREQCSGLPSRRSTPSRGRPSATPAPSSIPRRRGSVRTSCGWPSRLRCIGEGHVSSIGFAEAVIDADDGWTFEERATPLTLPLVRAAEWSRLHFGRALEHEGHLTDLASAVLSNLPERFTVAELEYALLELPDQLSTRPDSRWPTQAMRDMAASAYRADFPPDLAAERTDASARRCRGEPRHGRRAVRPLHRCRRGHRLSSDLHRVRRTRHRASADHIARSSRVHHPPPHRQRSPQQGDGALSPARRGAPPRSQPHRRREHLPRDDRSTASSGTMRASSIDRPSCGSSSSSETAARPSRPTSGWLVLTHGVGPLRTYSLGAILLDLDDPSRVVGRLREPLLQPARLLRDGYVPRVVYSCGAIAHRGTLWIPVGVGDDRIRVFSIGIDEVIASLHP